MAEITTDASGSPLIKTTPEARTPPLPDWKMTLLLRAGVKISKDGRSVFNYNPEKLTAGMSVFGVIIAVPAFFNRWFYLQLVLMTLLSFSWMLTMSDSEQGQVGELDSIIAASSAEIGSLTRFVLGLYVSLVLARTYYSNRGNFGTVFGSTMGVSQMISAWVRPLDGTPESQQKARKAQLLLVRWLNAAYRLLVLEVRKEPALSATETGEILLERNLLTEKEWNAISGISSRATHIYQWINNVIFELYKKGYICDTKIVTRMNGEVDAMRGANVWGLPSLPIVYTVFITLMVKAHLYAHTLVVGGNMKMYNMAFMDTFTQVRVWVILMADLALTNFLYQGLLDLHGMLYSPNGGECLGHLPADNFLDFVQDVTTNMVIKSGTTNEGELPYSLDELAD